MAGFEGLQSDFSKRLQNLMNAAPVPFTIASGFRSVDRQKQLFNSAVKRYGSEAAARKWVAPPGRSNHGKGIAADLGFPNDFVRRWVHANAAKFGLVFPMGHEPWHIEPLGGRSEAADPDAYTTPPEEMEGPADRVAGGLQSILTMMAEGSNIPAEELLGFKEEEDFEVPEFEQADIAGVGEEAELAGAELPIRPIPTTPRTISDAGGPGAIQEFTAGAGRLTPVQVADMAQRAGFRGQALITAVAVAMGESNLNPEAHNPNARTGDNSYGLWQINMLGGMGPERRQRFGLQSNDQLFDPLRNARAAFSLSGGGKDFTPWTVFTKGRYRRFLGSARQAVNQLGSRTAQRARRRAV